MKRLFCVVNVNPSWGVEKTPIGSTIKGRILSKNPSMPDTDSNVYFENKLEAKVLRDSIREDVIQEVQHFIVVTRGPDNLPSKRGYPSKYRRQPKAAE